MAGCEIQIRLLIGCLKCSLSAKWTIQLGQLIDISEIGMHLPV